MKNLIWLVVAVAVFLIWPEEFDLGGLAGEIAVILGLALLATPIAVHFAILSSLPEEVDHSEAPGVRLGPQMEQTLSAYEALGFEQAGPPLRYDLPREALLVPLILRGRGIIATAYRIDTVPPRHAFDVVSVLDAPDCGLTTGMDHSAGVIPGAPGQLRQIFQDATPAELVEQHERALHALERCNLPAMDVDPSAIPALIAESFRVNRANFLKARIVNTLLALWRTISKRNPQMGFLIDQPGIEEQLRSIPRPRRATRSGTLV
jgi:hypothetical protein